MRSNGVGRSVVPRLAFRSGPFQRHHLRSTEGASSVQQQMLGVEQEGLVLPTAPDRIRRARRSVEIPEVDGCAEFAVHQSLQVKASERVLGIATNQRSE